ncbi:MAG TPA: hypothetical protein VGQ76_20980 [Thermoanaerobaculia bacterium]|jgi:hypothetical protein|nr:hypothetical protein [Thermoanaerobaculia bacterium]
MNGSRKKVSPNAFLLATATIGIGALVWNARQTRKALALRAARSNTAPVWARATAIVAKSAGALLLLVRQKGRS